MKLGALRLSAVSLALLALQLLLVCSIAAKYLYQRWTCPRVWTRALAYDPELPMRGRYLSLQLMVDGCLSTLPSARQAAFPHDFQGVPVQGNYSVRGAGTVQFPAELKVIDNRLSAIGIEDIHDQAKLRSGHMVTAWPGSPCSQMRLDQPVSFFIAEHARDPRPLSPGAELWIEVTLPPQGPPRPLQLALKQGADWRPF